MNSTPFLGGEVDRAAPGRPAARGDGPRARTAADLRIRRAEPLGRPEHERGDHDRVAARRQPGRDRPPDHPHRQAARRSGRSRSTPRRTPACRSSPRRTRRSASARPTRRRATATPRRSWPPPSRPAPRRSTPATASCRENAEFARTVEANGLIWVGPGRRRDHRDGRQDQRPEPDGGGRRAGRARHHRPGRRPSTAAIEAATDDRLPGDGQGRRRRRRHGHGRRRRRGRRCAPSTTRSARSPSGCSATARC